MFWYKGKRVTLDLILGLSLGIMALGASESPPLDRSAVDRDINIIPIVPAVQVILSSAVLPNTANFSSSYDQLRDRHV